MNVINVLRLQLRRIACAEKCMDKRFDSLPRRLVTAKKYSLKQIKNCGDTTYA
jgi:hypothetical protein